MLYIGAELLLPFVFVKISPTTLVLCLTGSAVSCGYLFGYREVLLTFVMIEWVRGPCKLLSIVVNWVQGPQAAVTVKAQGPSLYNIVIRKGLEAQPHCYRFVFLLTCPVPTSALANSISHPGDKTPRGLALVQAEGGVSE